MLRSEVLWKSDEKNWASFVVHQIQIQQIQCVLPVLWTSKALKLHRPIKFWKNGGVVMTDDSKFELTLSQSRFHWLLWLKHLFHFILRMWMACDRRNRFHNTPLKTKWTNNVPLPFGLLDHNRSGMGIVDQYYWFNPVHGPAYNLQP